MIRMRFIGIIAVLFFSACEKSGFSYEDVPKDGDLQQTLLDTISITMRTVQIDSVITSGTGVALIGGYNDPFFGNMNTGTYFRVGLPYDKTVPDRAVYDSIEIIMKPTGYYYGDTLLPQRITVHQLTQELVLPEEYNAFYAHHSFPVQAASLGDQQVTILPTSGKLVRFRLDDVKGREMFELLRTKAQQVSTEDLFLEYMKGLAIRGNNNAAAFGFEAKDSSLFVRLHYHVTTTEIEEKYFDFLLTRPDLQFNEVRNDRTGTPLAALPSGSSGLLSSATGKQAFLQSLTGTAIRMDFFSLPDLVKLGRYGRIMRAQLLLKPVNGTFQNYAPPPKLTICLADYKNQVAPGDTVPDANSSLQYGDLVVDKLNPENTNYSYDVTAYCKAVAASNAYTYRGLLLVPTAGDYHTQLNRLIIGDGKNADYRAQLKVYYLLYQ
ncbi:DUF4270 family protein [Chitinophaga sp. SYP-B3965]|uniref:DUF4270 family protein n=1 Tax=Chitinophaga sp. SYP-B3965 TaxID=2663120 RepID=UPI001564BB2C|nr:DUF4270 family protein [Chitinophaga sp. SYP-B3965]